MLIFFHIKKCYIDLNSLVNYFCNLKQYMKAFIIPSLCRIGTEIGNTSIGFQWSPIIFQYLARRSGSAYVIEIMSPPFVSTRSHSLNICFTLLNESFEHTSASIVPLSKITSNESSSYFKSQQSIVSQMSLSSPAYFCCIWNMTTTDMSMFTTLLKTDSTI